MPESGPYPEIRASRPERSFADVTAPHRWAEAAGEHEGWDRLAEDPRATKIRNATLAVVHELGTAWERDRAALAQDPWLDPHFADLFTERVRWVIGRVLPPDELRLSAGEVALLVTFPYLHQAFWAKQAVEILRGVDPAVAAFARDTELPAFSAVAADKGALYRRGAHAFDSGDDTAKVIGWWLFHQWLAGLPTCYSTANLGALLPTPTPTPVRSVLTPARLTELMRVVQIDPAFLRRTDRASKLKPLVKVAGGTSLEQDMREQLLGYLLVFAHRTAIDPAVLPRLIVEHVGIKDGVTPAEVLESIRTASWTGERTRVLVAECAHPATVLALRGQAAAVDSVLTEIVAAIEETPHLEPLRHMPTHASADGVGTTGEDGVPVPAAVGHRFRLADDRIQELLMGEQLYGTPELAVRELYQNALDACRYREARIAYLEKTAPAKPADWSGSISFRQGTEDGRPFLECADNGIGMGDRELVDVFSRAGVRFADMPEYVEEQADWAAEGIESHPNSRFGIGVLSYFMLADEITVTTCRLDRKGNPDRRLEVHIAGPGALFRVRDLGAGDDAGTVVRLWLRPADKPLHCTELLRRILWVSDYRVESEDLSGAQTWEPGELSPMAPIGSDALAESARRTADVIVPADRGRVWWCDESGAVLADGIWAGTSVFGAVVNLTGHDLPRLTIDRKTIIDLDLPLVEALMRDAIPALLGASRSPLSHRWLSTLVNDMPRLADEICERAIDVGYRPWLVAGAEMPIEVVGCFREDEFLFAGHEPPRLSSWNDHIGAWRLAAWLRANPDHSGDEVGPVVPALPSDILLLQRNHRDVNSAHNRIGWLYNRQQPDIGHVLFAALRAHRSPAEVAARLTKLGWSVPDGLPADARPTDPLILGQYSPGEPPWLNRATAVPHDGVLIAAINAGLAPHAVAERLSELGYEVPTAARLPSAVHPIDRKLLRDDDVYSFDLSLSEKVSVAHIMAGAARTGRTPAEVARRLAELGYPVPGPEELPADHDNHDEIVFRSQTDLLTNRHVESPVSRRHITIASIRSGRTPARVAARLAEAGFEVPPEASLPESTGPSDATLIRAQNLLDPRTDKFHLDEVVEIGHVLWAALKTAQSPVRAAGRLTELGYTTPPSDLLPTTVDADDLVLVSTAIGSDRGHGYNDPDHAWLRTGQEVSPQHVFLAAVKTRRTPRAVARKLGELGFRTPPEAQLDLDVGPDDALLLSVALDSRPPWLTADHPALVGTELTLPLGYVLAAAARLGRTPAEIVTRLGELGLRAEEVRPSATVNPQDTLLLDRTVHQLHWANGRKTEFPWLGVSKPADRLHLLIAASRTALPPTDIAHRLRDLAIPVEPAENLPRSIDPTDLALLSRDLFGREPFRSLDSPFPRGEVMLAAYRTRTSPREVLERVRRLGLVPSL
ncbi:hypothetical protein LFM09_17075 [Lentzea alba]|uniref:wHTH domain-containing protein n=1 Tax=Lentzea alba TaxID=2714351 RepID=UPI0039BEE748